MRAQKSWCRTDGMQRNNWSHLGRTLCFPTRAVFNRDYAIVLMQVAL